MSGDGVALRLDDVGAASKQHEVHGLTRLGGGRLRLPFPGNVLFLKYVPPIKRWGPYRELTAGEWDEILGRLAAAAARLTVAVTAGWVESDGRVVPFPEKFPAAAGTIRSGVRRGLLEIANHGYTHCVLAGRAFRPRAFTSNRRFHREFLPEVPEAVQREHLARAQAILEGYFETRVVTFVPPGNAFTAATTAIAAEHGLRVLSCRDARRFGALAGLTVVDGDRVVELHDRDVVLGGVAALSRILARRPPGTFRMVREIAEGRR